MKIPSISELLDSPQLKPWVDKASRNVMLTSVKTFVARMSTDLQSRAADMKVPSVGEWAERIAQWIARREATAPHAEINATGVLLPEHATTPLAEEALHAVSAALRDYVVDRTAAAPLSAGQRVVADLARQLTGAEACLVTGSHSGAVLLALAALATERPVVVARGHVGELSCGVTLPQTARCAGVTLRECGIVERVRLEDYEEALTGAGAVLFMAGARPFSTAADAQPDLRSLAELCRRQQVPLLVESGLGGIVDPSRYGLTGIAHAAELIAQGADLVILSGDRLLGGPTCGLAIGRETAIGNLRKHGLFPSLAATPIALLPLAATLQLHLDLDTAERAIPLLSLLATSPENLKNRADRLAAQLVPCPFVASATATEGFAWLLKGSAKEQTLASWEVAIAPRQITATELAQRLASTSIPVSVRIAQERLYLNMRTVLPRHDMHLVDAFDELTAAENARSAVNASDEDV